MDLRRFETPGIAHYAYLICDGSEGALVDPSRDVQPYLDAARELGVRLRYILETHRQEDFVMGSAELARRSGAKIVNGRHKLFGHGDLRLKDGEAIPLGKLSIRALHTPGHTPESHCYAIHTDDDMKRAWCLFTGDTLFYRETGRTDLTDAKLSVENAGLLYDSVHDKLATLGDTALVLPAHGPGSVCGSGMAERPLSTLGEEKRFNPVFKLSRAVFAKRKGGEQMPRPPFFRHMEKVNLAGGMAPKLGKGDIPLVDLQAFELATEGLLVVDTREPEAFAGGHIIDSLNIWRGGLPVFGGWVADAETPLYLVTDTDTQVDEARTHLSNIGMDNVPAALAGGFGSWRKSGRPLRRSRMITPAELAERHAEAQIVDVREADEYQQGHIPSARHLYVGYLPRQLNKLKLDPTQPVVVTCSVGHRAGLAASLLLQCGFRDVRNLMGGMTAWKALDLPMEASGNAH